MHLRPPKPSKNVISLGIVTFGIIIVVLVAKFYSPTSGEKSDARSLQNQIIIPEKTLHTELDSDSDGVPDWEENLWNTDPHKKDSDGDGIDDKQAIVLMQQKANTFSLPDEPIVFAGNRIVSSTSTGSVIAQKLFSSYFTESSFATEKIGPSNLSSIARQTSDYTKTFTKEKMSPPTLSSLSELTILPNTTTENIKYYANTAITILSAPSAVGITDVGIFANFVEKEDLGFFTQMKSVAEQYNRIITELIAIPVPRELASVHLQLIRSIQAFTHATMLMSTIENDPIMGIQVVTYYQKTYTDFETTRKAWQDALLQRVSFTPEEPGYILIPS